jgi:hypothetical protein
MLRRAGGVAGVLGGTAAPPLAAPLFHIRLDVCLPVVILGIYNYFSKVWARLLHIARFSALGRSFEGLGFAFSSRSIVPKKLR